MPRRAVKRGGVSLSPQILYAPESEQAVLGCIMAQPFEVLDDVRAALVKEDFFVPAHQEVFKALCEMYDGKHALDVSTIHQWLTDKKLAEAVGSPGILAELLVGFATHLNVGSYIRIVKEKSLLRSLQAACSSIVQDITEMPDCVAAVLDRAETAIAQICQIKHSAPIVDAPALTLEFTKHLADVQSGKKKAAVKTGYNSIDRINGGLKPAGLHFIGARPGMGKTTAILNLTENLCKAGEGVGIISLEMGRIELAEAIYAFMADINSRNFKGTLTPEQLAMVEWASNTIRKWNLQIDDSSLVDVNGLRHKCRKMVRNGATVLMVDYLQLLEGSDEKRQRTRNDEVAEMSRALKLLAKELGVPIVVGAQLNRIAASEEPKLHHLRESGSIEADADVVIFLYQKDENQNTQQPTICWNFAKWRSGRADFTLEFTFDKTRNRFHEVLRPQID